MPDQPAGERTEQPTPRKLDKARREGKIAHSQELPAAMSITALFAAAILMSPLLVKSFSFAIHQSIFADTGVFADTGSFAKFLNRQILQTLLWCAPFMGMLLAGAIAGTVAVSGLNFSPKALEMKLEELNPASNLQKMFGLQSLMKLGVSIAKLVFISAIVWFYIDDKLPQIIALHQAWNGQILAYIGKLSLGMTLRICIGLVIVAAADVLFQKWKYMQDMRMTKQEVKQDHKDTEGMPEVKMRIRRLQIQMARKRMLADVPRANVVIVNPQHYAVALKYDAKTMESPVLLAKGADLLAAKIREIASENGIPIIRRPQLARTIYDTLEPGQPIPENLYIAVAEVLAMIYRLKHQTA